MLDFRKSTRRGSCFLGRNRGRSWLLVGAVGLVLLTGTLVRSSAGLLWLLGGGEGALAAAKQRSIDNLLPSLPRGEDTATPIIAPGGQSVAAAADTTGRYFPGLKPDFLKLIRDDTFFRSDENDAWQNLFGILRACDRERLERAGPKPVTYAQLFSQSSDFRGELVRVRGIVRRVHFLKNAPSEKGSAGLYQSWLFPADNPASPMLVYSLEVPEHFPTGMEVAEDVEVVGFFFKRKVYASKDTVRTAPTLLARGIEWIERPVLQPRGAHDPSAIVLAVGGALLVSLLVVAVIAARTRSRPLPEPDVPPDFQALCAAADEAAADRPSSDRSASP